MADPAFLWKLGFEQAITIGGGRSRTQAAHRGDRLKAEWDSAASNVLQLSVANAMTVWCLTPARSFGAAHKYGWQRVMDSIPNNAFDRCGPLRQYTMGTRAASLGRKALEPSALGAATGGVFHGLNKALVGLHRRSDADFEPAVPVPDLKTSVLGMGAYLGLSCNLRYQLIGGADRWMTERLTTLASAITATGLGRLANSQLGDQTRLFALGSPVHATAVRSAAPKKSKKKTVTKKVKKKKSKKSAERAKETARVCGKARARLTARLRFVTKRSTRTCPTHVSWYSLGGSAFPRTRGWRSRPPAPPGGGRGARPIGEGIRKPQTIVDL